MLHSKLPAFGQWKQNSWYLLFWPIFGLRYLLIENFHPASGYHPVYSALDDKIPFLEAFLIPYILWYACIIGMHLWLYAHEEATFRFYSRYLMISMSISTAVFLLYPTCQNLRPKEFPRENFLTELVRVLYRLDTSTNVCPSEHVIGSVGFFLAGIRSKKLKKHCILIGTAAFLTGSATVFLKQHSFVDVLVALPVCAAAYAYAYYPEVFEKMHLICRIKNRIREGRFSA